MRKKKREAMELQDKLEREAARERAQEAEALRRRGYLTADGHFPWRVPDELWGLYLAKYPDLGADVHREQTYIAKVYDNSPAKPARKRTAKKAATRTTKATP